NGTDAEALVALSRLMLDEVESDSFSSSPLREAEKKKNRATANELLAAPSETARPWWPFLQREGVLGPGVVVLCSGYAKSGKTTTMTLALDATLRAHPDLRVVWCTEEPRSLWRTRLLRWHLHWPTGTCAFLGGRSWCAGLADISAGDQAPGLIVVDTARAFMQVEDENDAGQWLA